MMSLSSGVLKLEVKEGKKVLNVVKHPLVEPIKIKVPTAKIWDKNVWEAFKAIIDTLLSFKCCIIYVY